MSFRNISKIIKAYDKKISLEQNKKDKKQIIKQRPKIYH